MHLGVKEGEYSHNFDDILYNPKHFLWGKTLVPPSKKGKVIGQLMPMAFITLHYGYYINTYLLKNLKSVDVT